MAVPHIHGHSITRHHGLDDKRVKSHHSLDAERAAQKAEHERQEALEPIHEAAEDHKKSYEDDQESSIRECKGPIFGSLRSLKAAHSGTHNRKEQHPLYLGTQDAEECCHPIRWVPKIQETNLI